MEKAPSDSNISNSPLSINNFPPLPQTNQTSPSPLTKTQPDTITPHLSSNPQPLSHTQVYPPKSFAELTKPIEYLDKSCAILFDNASFKPILYLKEMSKITHPDNIVSIAKVASKVRLFLKNKTLVSTVCNSHSSIVINGTQINFRPLLIPFKKIIISGAKPWLPNKTILNTLLTNNIPVVDVQFNKLGLDDRRYSHIVGENRFSFLQCCDEDFQLPSIIHFEHEGIKHFMYLQFESLSCKLCNGNHASHRCKSQSSSSPQLIPNSTPSTSTTPSLPNVKDPEAFPASLPNSDNLMSSPPTSPSSPSIASDPKSSPISDNPTSSPHSLSPGNDLESSPPPLTISNNLNTSPPISDNLTSSPPSSLSVDITDPKPSSPISDDLVDSPHALTNCNDETKSLNNSISSPDKLNHSDNDFQIAANKNRRSSRLVGKPSTTKDKDSKKFPGKNVKNTSFSNAPTSFTIHCED